MDRRGVLALAGGAALPLRAWAAPRRWDAIVDASGAPGTVATLGAALALARQANCAPFRILMREGVFVEQPVIDAPSVTIEGSGPGTILSFGASHGQLRADGTEYGTRGSSTLAVTAPDVTLRNLTIRNSFDYLGARRAKDGAGSQAVALRIDRAAERTRVERCVLEGYQDTFYVQALARISDCRILGGTDFIFGGGAAWFERCTIVTRHVESSDNHGYVTAPSTRADQRFGLVFADCRIAREGGVPDASAYLGRPWRAGGDMGILGEAVFLRCWMDSHIKREGWTWMGYRGANGEPLRLTPQEARLYEYASRGPGAGAAGETRKLLMPAQAADYTAARVLGGWR